MAADNVATTWICSPHDPEYEGRCPDPCALDTIGKTDAEESSASIGHVPRSESSPSAASTEEVAMHEMIGKIRTAYIGFEDHGILACSLDFDFGGSGQGIGGYALDEPVHDEDGKFVCREGTAYGMQFIAAVMRAAGVESWDKVQGRTVYVLRDSDGWNAKIVGIAPLPTESGERFIFEDLRVKHFAEPVA